MLADKLSVYLVADPDHAGGDLLEIVEAALDGGVTAVQLRAKTSTDRERFCLAQSIQSLCAAHSALFFVNDRLDIALAVGADGVHLGVDDLPAADARSVAPGGFVIGLSPNGDADAEVAKGNGVDYLGIGPVFGTHSKLDAGDAIGLDVLSRRAQVAEIPCIGIGGIDETNAASVIEAGAVGVAVMSVILQSLDPEKSARELARAVHKAKSHVRRV